MSITSRSKRCIPHNKIIRKFQTYCDILTYFSSISYVYKRMSMGLTSCSDIWQSYINANLRSITDISKYLVCMDGLLLHCSEHGNLKDL